MLTNELNFYFSGHPLVFVSLVFLLGLIVGSFLNVVIVRLPVMLGRHWEAQAREMLGQPVLSDKPRFDLVIPASHCPHCQHKIRAWENIPVVSFLWLKAKCSACGKAISWRYPLIELLSALLSAAVAWHFGYGVTTAAALLLTWSLISLTAIDYDTQLLPDDITLPLMWAGLLINLFGVFAPINSAVIGAIAGYISLWLIFHLFKLLTGKEGMGYGDFKLFAALGAWLGWQSLLLILLFASFIGAFVGIFVIVVFGRDRRLPIPFGPFLCGAGWVALMWGEPITRHYLQLARF